jgi:hypothetical protein
MELNNKIDLLLDKYFEGETSIQEEKFLNEYFAKTDVPKHLKQYQAMFAYFAENKKEIASQNIQLKPSTKPWYVNWIAKVAVVLLLLGFSYSFFQSRITDTEKKEAQIAFLETQKALNLISQNLNKGNQAVKYLDEFEVSKNKIFK